MTYAKKGLKGESSQYTLTIERINERENKRKSRRRESGRIKMDKVI